MRACTSMQPWDFKRAEPGPSTTLLGDVGSGCQLGLGLIVSGPSDVFLKHCVNPNEFWVPYCPSPILFNCKSVGFSLAQNYYYKSLRLRASQAVVEYIFSWADSEYQTCHWIWVKTKVGSFNLLSFNTAVFFLCVLCGFARILKKALWHSNIRT